MFVRYSDASKEIIRSIQLLGQRLPPLSIKYIPFCFMRGYEKYIMNVYQQSFDPDDWNYYFSQKVRQCDSPMHRILVEAAAMAGAIMLKERSFPRLYGRDGLKVFGLVRIVELLRKKRAQACRNCAYDYVCDHLYKGYLKHYGDCEISPVPGAKIADAAWSYAMAGYRTPGEAVKIRARGCAVVEPFE
jgi:hypothetical protein